MSEQFPSHENQGDPDRSKYWADFARKFESELRPQRSDTYWTDFARQVEADLQARKPRALTAEAVAAILGEPYGEESRGPTAPPDTAGPDSQDSH